MALFTYSARGIQIEMKSLVLFAQGHTVTGYAPDEFLTIETDDDDWTTEEGADGFVVRSQIPNKIAKITLTLQAQSPTNKVLTAMYNIGKGLGGINKVGTDIIEFSVREPLNPLSSGKGLLFVAPHTYVSKIAPMNYAKESGTRSWELTAVGGTFKQDMVSAILEASVNGARGAMAFGNLVNL